MHLKMQQDQFQARKQLNKRNFKMNSNLAYNLDDDLPLIQVKQSSAFLKKKTILIIEDDLILNQTIKRFAEKSYETVLSFDCTEKAENYLKNSNIKIDIALIDYFLPGDNGANFAKRLMKKNTDGKFYLMSGDLAHIKNEESLNSFKDFLAKPLSINKIKEIIEL